MDWQCAWGVLFWETFTCVGQVEYMNSEEDNPFKADEINEAKVCPDELNYWFAKMRREIEDIDIIWTWFVIIS